MADLLSKHRLLPDFAAALLRQLEPPACRCFQSIDDAVRWFRDRQPDPITP